MTPFPQHRQTIAPAMLPSEAGTSVVITRAGRAPILAALLLMLAAGSVLATPMDGQWSVQIKRVGLGDVHVEQVQGALQLTGTDWQLTDGHLRARYADQALGEVRFDVAPAAAGLAGSLRWLAGEGLRIAGRWGYGNDGRLDADLEQSRLRLRGPIDQLQITLDRLPIAPWRRWLGQRVEWTPARLEGELSGQLRWNGQDLSGELRLAGAGFDTTDGRRAAAGMGTTLTLAPGSEWPFQLLADAGELLWDEFYVALPQQGLQLAAAPTDGGGWRARASENQVFELSGSLDGQSPPHWQMDLQVSDLAQWHQRYLASYLQARAWAGVEPVGRLQASASGQGAEPDSATVQADLASLRLSGLQASGLQLDGHWRAAGGGHLRAQAQGSAFGELPLSGWQLQASQQGSSWVLQSPLQLRLLGGTASLPSLQVDLSVRPWQAQASLSLQQLELTGLMQALGWTPLPGRLSADFPGVTIEPQRIELQGGAEVNAFDGQVQLGAVSIERPLGPAPAISGNFDFEGLDLQGVTAAFGFGEIEGRLQGYVHDLRLVSGKPEAFDAWLASDPDFRGARKISQRAIDNLSAVGGGPGGAMSRSFLRVFETFRYDAIGLGCRLSQGVCQMRGLESANGGYLIVRGSGLPRITVMGHASRVNWTSLVARLLAATSGAGPTVE
ncbi:MAG: hypothetical protein R3F15_00855 [Lysobacterales bacterium]